MSQLVFIENGRPITDSLTVAEVFGKEHKRVMQDIRTMECSDEFNRHNFVLIDYTDSRNRTYPKYLITQDGFSFLVMGYTGKEASRFKEMYIKQFNQMREQINNKPSDPVKALIQATHNILASQEIITERLEDVEHKLEKQITLDSGQQRRLQKTINQRVCALEQIKEARGEWFRQLHKEIKDRWNVSSYKDVLKQDMQDVMNYVAAWVPIRREE